MQERDLVEGLAKGLRVIEAFDDEHPTLNATDCAERCAITRTAARRHLLTLVHLGYAATDGKRFWLEPRVLRLGNSFLEAARFPRLVQPFLQQLAESTHETVNLSVLDGHDVTYLARSDSPRVLSVGYQRGARSPAHAVAPGPLLAGLLLPDAELEAWALAHEFTPFTRDTMTDPMRFAQHARGARAQGWCILEQQFNPGYSGVAAALVDRRGRCHGAIGMAVASASWSRGEIEARLLPPLRATVAKVRAML
ncbi:IclR family transcriptional regulator domain-containing protein [Ramlibacter agri]|uniref:IclR family transcriptional regulator domain-containing protein n=1 Tax=Ramlibacter agri TaxID=2728837 RepID=UPI00315ACFEC